MNDPLIKTGAEIVFYVALGVLLVVLILKKRKQLNVIKENTPKKESDTAENE